MISGAQVSNHVQTVEVAQGVVAGISQSFTAGFRRLTHRTLTGQGFPILIHLGPLSSTLLAVVEKDDLECSSPVLADWMVGPLVREPPIRRLETV